MTDFRSLCALLFLVFGPFCHALAAARELSARPLRIGV